MTNTPQDSQTLTADGLVTWSDVAVLAEYYQATRSPDWELDKYQDAADRINKALRTADLRAELEKLKSALEVTQDEGLTEIARLTSPVQPVLEWRDGFLWFNDRQIGTVRREIDRPATAPEGYWWTVLCGAESGPYVGKDAAVSAIEIAARQWLSGGDK